MSAYHRPIMVDEVIRGLDVKDGGVYFDGTLGGGNHSYEILAANPTVKIVGTDRDPEAIEEAGKRLNEFRDRAIVVKSDFKDYERVLEELQIEKIDGYLLDLGISSHQIDSERRGFAYRMKNAPLDMRMDTGAALSARDVVNGYSEEALRRILREYGEERFASAIVRNIVRRRQTKPIETCGELEELVRDGIPPKFRTPACARQSFQAIRIECNRELEVLKESIEELICLLAPGGRLCIITFHSLEDRIVKTAFRQAANPCIPLYMTFMFTLDPTR